MVFKGDLQSYLFNFFQTFGDFAITRKPYSSHNPWQNFTAENYSVWKISMKTCLVMVSMFKHVQVEIDNRNKHNCFVYANGLTVPTEI